MKGFASFAISSLFIKDIDFNNKQLNIHIDFKKGSKFIDNSDAAAKAYTAYDTKMKNISPYELL